MTKVKQKRGMSARKDIKVNTGTVLTLKATTSLFATLLVIARSSRESVDLEEVIGMHEFAYANKIMMATDGTIHPSTDKSTVIKLLEYLVVNETSGTSAQPTVREQGSDRCLVVDGMGVVQELMAVQICKTCKELATSYITLVDSKARGYCQMRVIYDNYTKEASMKAHTRERRKGKLRVTKSYIVQASTGIKDKNTFLASSSTDDSLTLYLSYQLIRFTAVTVITATRQEVMTNYECEAMTSVSTQEEAGTLMIHHAVEVASNGMNVHIIFTRHGCAGFGATKNATSRRPFCDNHGQERNTTQSLPTAYCDKLGLDKSGVLINWHALTCCDTTGHVHGKDKNGCFAAFMKASPTIMIALAGIGEGDEPSEEVLRGCEEFLCSLFCPGRVHIGEAKMLRWFLFKQFRVERGVDKLPPTQGASMD